MLYICTGDFVDCKRTHNNSGNWRRSAFAGMEFLGWAIGVATLLTFASITFYTSSLLVESYRSPLTGKRNYTYMQAVQATLGIFNAHAVQIY